MLKAMFVYVYMYIHIIYLYRESQTQDVGTSVVGVGQEDPTKLSPGSSNLEKPDRLTEKQLKEVSVAVDIFGMETVSYETGGRIANLGTIPTFLCIISYSWTYALEDGNQAWAIAVSAQEPC